MSHIDTADRFVAIVAAAKAIYRIHEGPSCPPWEHLSRGLKLRYEEEARAALAAADAVRLDQAMERDD